MRTAALWLILVISSVLTTSVSAQPREQAYAVIDAASASYADGVLWLKLRITRDSWRSLADKGIDVGVTVAVGSRDFRFDAKMDSASDDWEFTIPRGTDVSTLRLSVGGRGRNHTLSWIVVHGIELTSLPLRVSQRAGSPSAPPPGPPPPSPTQTSWGAHPRTIQACGDSFDGSANERACLEIMSRFHYDPVPVIASCDTTMDGDANELACVRVAAGAFSDPSAALARCDSAMDGDANEKACLELAITARFPAAKLIDACETAMDGDAGELACITAGVTAASDPSETINACEKAMDGDESELACIKQALAPGRAPAR